MTNVTDVQVPSARLQLPKGAPAKLDSVTAGLMIHRTALVKGKFWQEARIASRRITEYLNTTHGELVTVFVYEEVAGKRDRIHWLFHFNSFVEYEELIHTNGSLYHNDLFCGLSADQDAINKMFVDGSVQETVLLPHRWGSQGTITEKMAQDPETNPLAPGEMIPRFLVQSADHQTTVEEAKSMNSATAGIVMHRVSDFNYEFRTEARIFARTVAENVNLNMNGLASAFLYEEQFGPMDRVHWLIHMKSLDVYYQLMGLDARVDPNAPRASYLQDWIPPEKGGGSWDKILIQGSVQDSALRPQYWGD